MSTIASQNYQRHIDAENRLSCCDLLSASSTASSHSSQEEMARKFPWAASVTLSKSTESYAGMSINGEMAKNGYSKEMLEKMIDFYTKKGCKCELIALHTESGTDREAYVAVFRNAHPHLLDGVVWDLEWVVFQNLDEEMYNRRTKTVQTRRARQCVCIGDKEVKADIPNGVGGVVSYANVPSLQLLRDELTQIGEELHLPTADLLAEVNHYDPEKGYIGFHGDGERPDVIGATFGAAKELHFQGFCGADPVGKRVTVALNHGDMYVMDEDACGHNWVKERTPSQARRGCVHYRHAACAPEGNPNVPSNKKILEMRAKKKVKSEQQRAEKKRAREEMQNNGGGDDGGAVDGAAEEARKKVKLTMNIVDDAVEQIPVVQSAVRGPIGACD